MAQWVTWREREVKPILIRNERPDGGRQRVSQGTIVILTKNVGSVDTRQVPNTFPLLKAPGATNNSKA